MQQSNYPTSHPEMPASQSDIEPGGGFFKRMNYMNPEQLFDRGNDWVEFVHKNFIQ